METYYSNYNCKARFTKNTLVIIIKSQGLINNLITIIK